MPDYTVKADVDAMLRADNDAAIRSAIGVGTTDAPTFLAQTLTGQSLTASQATNLLNLSTTWDTIGSPSLIYGRVTNTNSSPTANLIDLGTFAGGSLFSVSKTGVITTAATQINTGGYLDVAGVRLAGGRVDIANLQSLQFTSGGIASTADIMLTRDSAGILAQRNAAAAQQFRVYNSFTGVTGDNDWGVFGFASAGANLKIGTQKLNSGGSRPVEITSTAGIYFNPAGGGLTWQFGTSGHLTAITDNAYDIGASGANRPRHIYMAGTLSVGGNLNSTNMFSNGPLAPIRLLDGTGNDFSRLQLGGTTSAFPAIKRNGTGIDIRLADDSAFAPLAASAISYTASVLAASGSSGAFGTTGTEKTYINQNSLRIFGFDSGLFLFGAAFTNANPAIKRNGTELQAKLADDSTFTFIQGKLKTETAYTGTTVVATGYITIYDSTGTAYRVPCTV